MPIIDNIIQAFKQTQTTTKTTLEKSVTIAVDENKRQMRLGMDSKDASISPYSPSYASYKSTLSTYRAPSGTPDLYLSGAFQNSMFGLLSSDYSSISIDSKDSKSTSLKAKYGADIFGLGTSGQRYYTAAVYRSLSNQMFRIWR